MDCLSSTVAAAMDCPKLMWTPNLEPTKMSTFLDRVNAKYTLRLGGCSCMAGDTKL